MASRIVSNGTLTVAFVKSTTVTLTDGVHSFPYTTDPSSRVHWIHIGESDIGYLLQQSSNRCFSIGIDLQTKEGDYNMIGVNSESVTKRTLTIWIDHGPGPFTRDSSYLIFPEVTLPSFPALIAEYAKEQVFFCQANRPNFHGVFWPGQRRASFVLWKNVAITFSCQSPNFRVNLQMRDAGDYLLSETDRDFTLTSSHPKQSIRSSLSLSIVNFR